MQAQARWLLLLLLLLPCSAQAKIFLSWELDRAYQPQPTFFDLVLEGPISPGKGSVTQTIRVGASAPWACAFSPRRRLRDVLCRAGLPRARAVPGHRLCCLAQQEEWAIEYVYDAGRHGTGLCRTTY
jgi:hypothetical protein